MPLGNRVSSVWGKDEKALQKVFSLNLQGFQDFCRRKSEFFLKLFIHSESLYQAPA